ncbi:MAG: DUF493 domain-containing protein [Pseudomonadota bacterium]
MTVPESPKIDFPCEHYPIKIMGDASTEMEVFVIETVERHAPGFDRERITIRASGKGRFQSITVYITATGIDQLKAMHQELVASSMIKMVL